MIYRDQFGMQHEGLFSRAMQGTKVLVEKYLETMAAGLNFICDSPIADEEVSRLVDRLVDRLIGWLVDRLVDW
jgi:hypothetical protein